FLLSSRCLAVRPGCRIGGRSRLTGLRRVRICSLRRGSPGLRLVRARSTARATPAAAFTAAATTATTRAAAFASAASAATAARSASTAGLVGRALLARLAEDLTHALALGGLLLHALGRLARQCGQQFLGHWL